MLDSVKSKTTRTLLRAQHYFFFPILLFARMSWCHQSVLHASDLTKVCPPYIMCSKVVVELWWIYMSW